MKSKEAPKKWDVRTLFPGKTDEEIAELVAEFFNSISCEFRPLEPDWVAQGADTREFLPYQIAGRLRAFKKPKFRVAGDLPPCLVNSCSDILAIPLTIIYNEVAASGEWPRQWTTETVTIIPKNSNPSGLSECRNLSCTPLFSKVLEAFVLDELRKETKLLDSQYGGLKGMGVDHFLVKTWDELLTGLEAVSYTHLTLPTICSV